MRGPTLQRTLGRMNEAAHPVQIDTRLLLRVYAAAAIVSGVVIAGFAPSWLNVNVGGVPWVEAATLRVTGSLLIAAGCFGVALGTVEDPESRRRGLLWFAVGLGVVALVSTIQHVAVRGTLPGVPAGLLWAVVLLFFYGWQAGDDAGGRSGQTVSLFDRTGTPSVERLRSEYERRIRQAAAQEERNRLARDLHDSIKQHLFAIHTAAATAQARFDAEPSGAKAAIDQIRDSAREATSEMEAMLQGLRATPLENVGLIEAVKSACEALAFRTGARVEFVPGELPPGETLLPGAPDAIFRVAQEAFANIGRHARARHVSVTLAGSRGAIELTVKDDGAGFDLRDPARGQGIANMRARASEYGGHVELMSQPGGGTRVRLTVPGAASDPADAGYYARRAVMFGLVALLNLLGSVRDADFAITLLPCGALLTVFSVREFLAYRRVRRPVQARR